MRDSNLKRVYSSKSLDNTTTETRKNSKQYKQEYELTEEQIDTIIGIMLADGFRKE